MDHKLMNPENPLQKTLGFQSQIHLTNFISKALNFSSGPKAERRITTLDMAW